MTETRADYLTKTAIEIVRHKCPNPECDNILGFETSEGYWNTGGSIEDIEVIRGRCAVCKTRVKLFSGEYKLRKMTDGIKRRAEEMKKLKGRKK